jgi:hypothetical protein
LAFALSRGGVDSSSATHSILLSDPFIEEAAKGTEEEVVEEEEEEEEEEEDDDDVDEHVDAAAVAGVGDD